ncbi:MAG: cytochrome C [Nitrospirae bacterium]|nr:cytochrome C [Nitrospirota bacterium]
MKVLRSSGLTVVIFLITVLAVFLFFTGAETAQTKPELSNDDCLKCHDAPPSDLSAHGGKHKDVGCLGCHIGHPPTVKKPIPLCSNCHMGKPHFELKGCLNCHKNPHTPLNIAFGTDITDACLTCHSQQIVQLRDHKSKHSALNCSMCHDVHRKIPQCTQCHKPHSSEMAASDCRNCHKPHMPTVVTYAASIPSTNCGACHKKVLDTLTASSAKHQSFACAFCHQEKHKMVPNCQDCHGLPHPKGIHAKFDKCGECHNIAHDLNNWSDAEKKESPKEAPKAAPAKKK